MAEFVDDVPHWKLRLVEEGHSRGHLQYIVATASTTHAQSKAARELLDESDRTEAAQRAAASLAQADKHHADRQWWTRFSAWVGVFGLLLALVSFLAGRFWPTAQVSSLERRVAALEQNQTASAQPNLIPTTPPQLHLPQQTAATPQVSATPSPAAQTTPAPKTTP